MNSTRKATARASLLSIIPRTSSSTFFTGYYKQPVGGFRDLTFERVDSIECSPLVGEIYSKTLRIPSRCLTNITTFEDTINKAVVRGI
mmetsp:Transcript_77520/g.171237  ORF Transcript_77520/g.171237 Transcript_77520/m.171237 type:complete len:88 (+) Transcript_77520:995-1258(+)